MKFKWKNVQQLVMTVESEVNGHEEGSRGMMVMIKMSNDGERMNTARGCCLSQATSFIQNT